MQETHTFTQFAIVVYCENERAICEMKHYQALHCINGEKEAKNDRARDGGYKKLLFPFLAVVVVAGVGTMNALSIHNEP